MADFQKRPICLVKAAGAELREAQTMTMDRLSNTGQAVIIDWVRAGHSSTTQTNCS
ncbi:MAG: hypothetical protein IPG82_22065 [Saprospiraceae bacterium]|nr:hypothetical protein [Saprospiraceae bacterium]